LVALADGEKELIDYGRYLERKERREMWME